MSIFVSEDRLRMYFNEIYVKGWTHGSFDLSPMSITAIVDRYIEDCKKDEKST